MSHQTTVPTPIIRENEPTKEMLDQEKAKIQTASRDVFALGQKAKTDKILHNEDINRALESSKEVLDFKSTDPTVRPQVRQLAADTKDVVEDVQRLVREKNADEKVQSLIQHTAGLQQDLQNQRPIITGSLKEATNAVDTQALSQQGNQLLMASRRFFVQLLRDSSLRSQLQDLFRILGEIFQFEFKDPAKRVKEKVKANVVHPLINVVDPDHPTGVKEGAQQIKEGSKQAAAEEKERAQVNKERIQSEGGIGSREQRRQLSDQLDSLLQTLAGYPAFVDMVNVCGDIIDTLEPVMDQVTDTLQQGGSSSSSSYSSTSTPVRVLDKNSHLAALRMDLKRLIESFTKPMTLDKLENESVQFVRMIRDHPDTQQLYNDWREFLSDVLENPERLQQDERRRELRQLFKQLNYLDQDHRLRHQMHVILLEMSQLIQAIGNDPALMELQADINKLVSNLAKMTVNPNDPLLGQNLWENLRPVVLPALVEVLRFVPIPDIVGGNQKYQYEVRNVILRTDQILPDNITMKTGARFTSGVQSQDPAKFKTGFRIIISGIRTEVENAYFHFRRLRFPRVKDEGLADFGIDRGADLDIRIVAKDNFHVMKVKSVKCNLHGLRLKVRDSNHRYMENMMLRLFRGTVRRRVETQVEDSISDTLNSVLFLIGKAFASVLQQTKNVGVPSGVQPILQKAQDNIKAAASKVQDVTSSAPQRFEDFERKKVKEEKAKVKQHQNMGLVDIPSTSTVGTTSTLPGVVPTTYSSTSVPIDVTTPATSYAGTSAFDTTTPSTFGTSAFDTSIPPTSTYGRGALGSGIESTLAGAPTSSTFNDTLDNRPLSGTNLGTSDLDSTRTGISDWSSPRGVVGDTSVYDTPTSYSTFAPSGTSFDKNIGGSTFDTTTPSSTFGTSDFGSSNLGTTNFGSSNLGTTDFGSSNVGTSDFGSSNLDTSNFGTSNFGTSDFGSSNLGTSDFGSSNVGGSNLSSDISGFSSANRDLPVGFNKDVLDTAPLSESSDRVPIRKEE